MILFLRFPVPFEEFNSLNCVIPSGINQLVKCHLNWYNGEINTMQPLLMVDGIVLIENVTISIFATLFNGGIKLSQGGSFSGGLSLRRRTAGLGFNLINAVF